MPITLTDNNFTDEVEKATLPVLVDFWAPWCGPCKVQGPIVEELARELDGKVKVGKIDVDENQKTSSMFNIMSIPTLAIFQNGKIVKTMVGVTNKDTLKQTLQQFL